MFAERAIDLTHRQSLSKASSPPHHSMAPTPDTEGRLQTYLTVFKHTNLDVDWKAFAAELGISNAGNA